MQALISARVYIRKTKPRVRCHLRNLPCLVPLTSRHRRLPYNPPGPVDDHSRLIRTLGFPAHPYTRTLIKHHATDPCGRIRGTWRRSHFSNISRGASVSVAQGHHHESCSNVAAGKRTCCPRCVVIPSLLVLELKDISENPTTKLRG